MEALPAAEDFTTESARFFEALNGCLTGELERFQTGLAGPLDPRPGVAAGDLLEGDMMASIVARFDERFGATDPRAILSMWSLISFTAMLPPLLTANILLDVQPALALDRVTFIISPTHRIEALKIGPDLMSLSGAGASRFDGLVWGVLAPFIDLAAAKGGLTQRVLWSNAGHIFEAFCSKLEAVAPERPGLEHARKLFARRTLADGGRNPLFEPVRYVQGRRIRKVCCMRYLVPNDRVCGVCPLPPDSPARAGAA